MIVSLQRTLRQWSRTLIQHFPGLLRFRGIGLGRLLTAGVSTEQMLMDGDIRVEIDLRYTSCRAIYFVCDPTSAAETILSKRLLQSSDTFVDVGANFGYFTLIGAKYAGRVFAFEPSPATYAHLQRNLHLNPALAAKVTSAMKGLAGQPGEMRLYRPTHNPGTASLQPLSGPDVVTEIVQIDTLDRLLRQQPVHFIKIDVEGAELDVLQGARSILHNQRPLILVELFEPHQQRFGRSCQRIVDFLETYDYEGRWIRQDQDSLEVRLAPLNLKQLIAARSIENALFIPRERAAAVPKVYPYR